MGLFHIYMGMSKRIAGRFIGTVDWTINLIDENLTCFYVVSLGNGEYTINFYTPTSNIEKTSLTDRGWGLVLGEEKQTEGGTYTTTTQQVLNIQSSPNDSIQGRAMSPFVTEPEKVNCPQFADKDSCMKYLKGEIGIEESLNFTRCIWNVYYSGLSPYQTYKIVWNAPYIEKYYNADGLKNVKIKLGVYGQEKGQHVFNYSDYSNLEYIESFAYFAQSSYPFPYMCFSMYLEIINDEEEDVKQSAQCIFTIQNTGNKGGGIFTDENSYGYIDDVYYSPNLTPHINDIKDGSQVVLISGSGDDDEGYLERSDELNTIDITDYYDGSDILTNTYACNIGEMNNIANELWEGTFLDNIKLLNNNPIENLVSANLMPFDTSNETSKTVHIGNVDMKVSATGVNNGIFDIGTFTVQPYYYSYADYEPFTQLYIYLPFLGYMELSIADFINRTVRLRYVVDYSTGDCNIILFDSSTNTILNQWRSNCAISIRVTNSGLNEQLIGNMQAVAKGAISAVGGLATGGAVGAVVAGVAGTAMAVATNTAHASGGTINTSSTDSKTCLYSYLLISRPQWEVPKGFAHTHGRPCNLTQTISNLTGFTKVAQGADLSGIACTQKERQMIESLLTSGIFA